MTYGNPWQWYASNAALVFVLSTFCEGFGFFNSVWPLELYAFLPLAYAVCLAYAARDAWCSEREAEWRDEAIARKYRELYESRQRSATHQVAEVAG